MKTKYDAVIVGSGPNGFAAAITLIRQGLSVLLIEANETLGGGARSAELTLPGYIHDVCSSVFPLAENSPVFKSFDLLEMGLQYIEPELAVAHPFDGGSAAFVKKSIEETAAGLGTDSDYYKNIFTPFVNNWPDIRSAFLGPLHFSALSKPKLEFGYYALSAAVHFAKHQFSTKEAQALFAGMAAHSILPLDKLTTSSIGIVLNILAHINGWPVAKGGAQQITNALAARFTSLGGEIECGNPVTSLKQLPSSKIILLDVTPAQLLSIAGDDFSRLYKWQLNRYRYGAGVFKVDWALSDPVPFVNAHCRSAGTVHIGGTMEEIRESESLVSKNIHPKNPFVLFVQPTVIDESRAPQGKHIGWGYCHVPNGSTVDMTEAIENQIERFAPGFRDCIIQRHVMNTADMQQYNNNYVGGDINGGAAIPTQLFTRPALRLSPYRTAAKGIYVCSSSTPPGGGVHGICGYYAARRALKDYFDLTLPWL